MALFFSVVIPLYNKKDFISEAIKSVLNQKFEEFELLIVDDGSSDGSAGVVSEYFGDHRLKLITQDNQGEGAARNTGIQHAQADWIAFLDADDYWSPSHLAELKQLTLEFPDAGMVSTATVALQRHANHDFDQVAPKLSLIDYFRVATRDLSVVHSSSVALSRAAIESVGLFSSYKAGADLEMWARVAVKFRCAVSSKATSVYVLGTGGVMDSLAAKSDKSKSVPRRLSDISPSVAFLSRYIEVEGRDFKLYRSVCAYINSRIDSSIKSAIARQDFRFVRAARKLYLRDAGVRPSVWAFLSFIPSPVFDIGIKGRRALRYTWLRRA